MTTKKPVILCVDDEKFVLDVLNVQLQKKFGNQYDYEFAERPEEAIELIQQLAKEGHNVIMVISDQIMPGMTGDQFLSEVHKQLPAPIKILLTGQASIDSAVNAINNANLYRYLTKPWEQEDFLLTVDKGLEQYRLMDEVKKQAEAFKRFVPQEFVEALGVKDLTNIQVTDHVKREMSILFSDIRNFTTLSESLSVEEVYEFINEYAKYIEPPIRKNNGFIDKFIGDAVMALFYTPEDAVNAAIDMQRAILQFNQDHQKNGYGNIKSGIGIHVGMCMLGIVGVQSRMQGTVISDAVNLASRIEAVAAATESSVVVTKEVAKQLEAKSSPHNYRFLGTGAIKGKKETIMVYELLDPKSDEGAQVKIDTKKEFEEAIDLFLNKKFTEASVQFNAVLQKNPKDKVAGLYLKLAATYMVEKVPDSWNVIEF